MGDLLLLGCCVCVKLWLFRVFGGRVRGWVQMLAIILCWWLSRMWFRCVQYNVFGFSKSIAGSCIWIVYIIDLTEVILCLLVGVLLVCTFW